MLEIKKLDHLVLTVHDIQKTCTFYHDYLGMTIVQSLEGRVALHFGQQKINLHQLGHEFQPKANIQHRDPQIYVLSPTIPWMSY